MIRLFLGLALLVATCGAGTAETSPAEATVRRMGRGINILGYDGIWDGHADAPFRTKYFRLLREAGFQHVRINFHAFRHMDGANRMDPAVLARLDGVLEHTVAVGLVPVLDVHDFAACQRDPEGCAIRLKAFWTEIAKRYARRFPSAVYEILNEPGGAMTLARWTALQSECLRIIRQHDLNRTIVAALLNLEAPLAARARAAGGGPQHHRRSPLLPADALHASGRALAAGPSRDLWHRLGQSGRRGPGDGGFRGDRVLGPSGGPAGLCGRVRQLRPRPDPSSRTICRPPRPDGGTPPLALGYWQFDHDFAVIDTNTETWARPLLDALVPPGKPVPR